MKKFLPSLCVFIFIFLASCSKSSDPVIEELPVLTEGTVKIEANDERYYPFSLKAETLYTLSLDFSEYNYESDSAQIGSRQVFTIDWGENLHELNYDYSIWDQDWIKYKCPKSSICFMPKHDLIFKIKVLDNDFSNNSGYANISVEIGYSGFVTGNTGFTIPAGNNNYYPVALVKNRPTNIGFDFSQHTYTSNLGELSGWQESYQMVLNNGGGIQYNLQLGEMSPADILFPYSSFTIISNSDRTINFQITDNDYSDNQGNIYLRY